MSCDGVMPAGEDEDAGFDLTKWTTWSLPMPACSNR